MQKYNHRWSAILDAWVELLTHAQGPRRSAYGLAAETGIDAVFELGAIAARRPAHDHDFFHVPRRQRPRCREAAPDQSACLHAAGGTRTGLRVWKPQGPPSTPYWDCRALARSTRHRIDTTARTFASRTWAPGQVLRWCATCGRPAWTATQYRQQQLRTSLSGIRKPVREVDLLSAPTSRPMSCGQRSCTTSVRATRSASGYVPRSITHLGALRRRAPSLTWRWCTFPIDGFPHLRTKEFDAHDELKALSSVAGAQPKSSTTNR